MNIEAAIEAISHISIKPMQGKPEIILDYKKDLTISKEWSEDVLGEYAPQHVRITLYIKAIHQASTQLHIPEDDLCLVVLLHELGHWLWHMALDDYGNNWQNYGQVAPDLSELLAQLCVCWASHDGVLQSKKEQINFVLFELMKKQSTIYKLPKEHACLKPLSISPECFYEIRELQFVTLEPGTDLIDLIIGCIEVSKLVKM